MIESMNVCLRLNSLGKEWFSFLFKFQPFFFHIPYLAKEMQLAAKMNAMHNAGCTPRKHMTTTTTTATNSISSCNPFLLQQQQWNHHHSITWIIALLAQNKWQKRMGEIQQKKMFLVSTLLCMHYGAIVL